MNNSAIQIRNAERSAAPIDILVENVATKVREAVVSAKEFYEGESPFFSAILGERCTVRTAVRVNAITACIILLIGCAAVSFKATAITLAATAWLVWRLRSDEYKDKEGGER